MVSVLLLGNPTNDWNSESKFHLQNIRNAETKRTVLDSPWRGEREENPARKAVEKSVQTVLN